MRLALLFVALLFASPLAHAQTVFGVRAGLDVATVDGFDAPEGTAEEPRLGLVAGVWGRHTLLPLLDVQGELGFAQKGGRVVADAAADGAPPVISYDLEYVEASLLARVSPPLQSALELGLVAGPTFGIAVSERTRFGGVASPQSVLNATDLGIALGGDVGAGPVSVGLRYTTGLWDINRAGADIPDEELDPVDLTNGAFSATLRYRFAE